jgi:hypothetical protein
MSDVFVSYPKREWSLCDDLSARDKDVWVDVDGIRDAEVFPAALQRAIEGAGAFVFVISADSLSSSFCDQEVAHASELNKRIVPLALHEVSDDEIPDQIRVRNWIAVGDGVGADIDRVVAAIDTDLEWKQEHARVTLRVPQWHARQRDPRERTEFGVC